ncbi:MULTISPECIES: hypothetical protein [Rhizobium]|uniref:SHOCT domain-containing protein n=1 Tax=Rhizobium tropici TaxID=398 RepID=A0A329YG00_RHITR|nr:MULTISPECIES: hypothetical protein [Rhizobium]MBB3288921.1 hypothetical protein [Rhizobium sp. BK252]MBB3403663.1 hypothetical protein [Rhizobium sp. BK289]MBB3416152.1 hypothetical protein [Rhizobium sp. BK284]MBB3484126.1 hypothetical protein [Rhizobium sp. BK347]MDK4720209.1 hypothetical protein [Rhizobium sp. CNPSo 3968]
MGGGMVARLNRYSVLCGAMCGILALTLAGCSTPEEKAAYAKRKQPPQAVIVKPAKGTPIVETSTQQYYKDGYPSFNAPPTAANVQINDQQAGDMVKQLTALGAQRKAGTISEAEYQKRVAEMRKLAAEHGQDTLQEIQKEGGAQPAPTQN